MVRITFEEGANCMNVGIC